MKLIHPLRNATFLLTVSLSLLTSMIAFSAQVLRHSAEVVVVTRQVAATMVFHRNLL